MDMRMPVTDGVEATRQFTQQFPGLPVLGLSSEPEKYAAPKMMEASDKGYLNKDVFLVVIEAAI